MRILVFARDKPLLHAHDVFGVRPGLVLAVQHELFILIHASKGASILFEVGVVRVDMMVLDLRKRVVYLLSLLQTSFFAVA